MAKPNIIEERSLRFLWGTNEEFAKGTSELLLTVAEAAAHLRISSTAFVLLVRRKGFRAATKVGKAALYRSSDVELLADERAERT